MELPCNRIEHISLWGNEGERDREGEGLDKLDGGQWQTSGNYSTDVLSLRRNEVVSLMQFKEETGVI